MERLGQSGGSATKSFLKALKNQSSRGKPRGRKTSSRPSRLTQIGRRRSSRLISRGLTGKSGSLRWLHPTNIRGRCILFGNFCITIQAPCHCSQTIHFRTSHLITSERDSIVINSRRSAKKRGGNANPSANGCLRYRRITRSSVACSKRWFVGFEGGG